MSEFFDTSDLDDMINEINEVAEGIEMAPDIVKQVLESYLPLWKRLAPIDSGRLRQSIKIVAQGGNYGISINYSVLCRIFILFFVPIKNFMHFTLILK